LHRTGRGGVRDHFQAGEVIAVSHLFWELQETNEHGGHHLDVRDPVALDQLEHLDRVELLHQDHRPTETLGQH
jgi:hypothetical protein